MKRTPLIRKAPMRRRKRSPAPGLLVDERCLAKIRAEPCAFTGKSGPSEAHHIFGRGQNGWGRIDHVLTVLPMSWVSHVRVHCGQSSQTECLAAIEKHTGVPSQVLREAVWVCKYNGVRGAKLKQVLDGLLEEFA